MPFGNGPHMCPGSELARVEALFLLHHLVTKFRCSISCIPGVLIDLDVVSFDYIFFDVLITSMLHYARFRKFSDNLLVDGF